MANDGSDFIPKVLESLGWPSDGNFIPVANDENSELLRVIAECQAIKLAKSKLRETNFTRAEALKAHFGNATQEVEQNLRLINAHRSQSETENHMLKIAIFEENKYKKQIDDIENGEAEIFKYNEKAKKEIEKINGNLSSLSEKINWARGAFDEFRQSMQQGESAKLLIDKYCKIDSSRADVMESKRKIIQDQISKQRDLLINAYEEQKSMEQVLERTAQLYRQAHVERRHLVTTWKDAVNQMNQREKDIQQSETDLDEAIEQSNKKNQNLKEQMQFLEQQMQNNRDTEQAISDLNKQNSLLKAKQSDLEQLVSLRNSEFATAKKTVYNVATRLNTQRQKNRQAQLDKENRIKTLEKEHQIYNNMVAKEKTFRSRNFSAQDRLKQIDDMIESEEKIMKSVQTEISRLSGALYRSQQQLKDLQDEEKTLTMDLDITRSAIVTTKSQFKIQEKELLRQTEMVYNVDYGIQNMEHRINNMKGVNVDRDMEYENRIIWLEAQVAKKSKNCNLLQIQVSKVEDDMKQLTVNYSLDNREYERLGSRLEERQLHCEGGEKKINKQTVVNQDRLVETIIVKMKHEQLEMEIGRQDNKSFNLEKHKLSLEFAMKQRLLDIKVQKDLLFLTKKSLNDEISQLRADVGDRNIKIEALKKRYECALDLLGRNDDGSIITSTQIKIRAVQEKHLLLREGNTLNEHVLQAEEDIKAMENTLRLMNYSNENYRKQCENVDDNNPMVDELTACQDAFCNTALKLKHSKTNIAMRNNRVAELVGKLEGYDQIFEDITRARLDNNDVLMKIHKELIEQKTKLQRAERELKTAIKSCRIKINDPEYLMLYDKDMSIREMEERNASVLQQLSDLVENNMEMAPAVSKSLFERGLVMPCLTRVRSQTSWRSNISVRSVDSDYSAQALSVSSKASSGTSISSKKSAKASSVTPSIVMIGLPPATSLNQEKTQKKICATTLGVTNRQKK